MSQHFRDDLAEEQQQEGGDDRFEEELHAGRPEGKERIDDACGQNDDADVLEEKVTKEVYDSVEKSKVYCFWGTKRILRDGNIRISYDYVEPISGNEKAMTK